MKFDLKPRFHSHKDYSSHKTLGLGMVSLPINFQLSTPILDQGASESCTAYSAVGARDTQKNNMYNPLAFWNDELTFAGVTDSDGFDLGVPAAVGVKTGFIKADDTAGAHVDNASAYLWVTPNNGLDIFDSVRQVVYQQNAPVIGGVMWYSEWTNAPQGIISVIGQTKMGGHAIRIAGWKQEGSTAYIGLANTWGTGYGDNGWYWMERSVFNQCFVGYGLYYFIDSMDFTVKTLGLLQACYQNLCTLFANFGKPKNFPPQVPDPAPVPPAPIYLWDTPADARLSVRELCDAMGLPVDQKNILCACVEVESNFNPKAVHYNKDQSGAVWSADWGICQINDYWNIGAGKPFPSTDYVLNNPEECVRWMAKEFLAGHQSMWASYTSGLYKKYL